MKLKYLHILVIISFASVSCGEQGGFMEQLKEEQTKEVRAYAPEMNNMEMLSMTQLPGWQLLAGTQWIGNTYCNSIKGVNDQLNATFYYDGRRGYTHSNSALPTTDGQIVFMNYMSAPDYLDFVFRRQFPNVKNAKRTMLKTLDQFPEEERQQVENTRVMLYNDAVQYNNQSAGASFTHIRNVTADRAKAEYRWVQDGDSIIHFMDVFIHATYMDFRSHYHNSSMIQWAQGYLLTGTVPVKNSEKANEDLMQILPSIRWNEQYINACNNIVMQGIQRTEAETRRIQGEMAQAEIRHQQRMTQILQETNDYAYKTRQEVFANQQASQERINQGWRDVVVGVDRYMGTDGKVVEVPVSMGSQVWQNAESGTIYTSDSYLFHAVDQLPDKDGIVREFRQLQLLK